MPLSLSQEDNVVDNRPLPAKPTGAEAVAAFRAGQTSSKQSKPSSATTSPSKQKDKEKRKRKSSAPTSPPHSPPSPPTSPPSSGSGRKRKAAVVQPEQKKQQKDEDDEEDVDESENASSLDGALADFVPASLSPLPQAAASQPLWLFQFPAKFDVAAFSALRLSLPTAVPAASAAGRVSSRFQLHGEHYRIIEADASDTTDIVNLFPASHTDNNNSNNLTLGRPFTRVLRITLDEPSATTAGWQHSTAALKRKVAVPAAKGLTVHFRPIGYMADAGRQQAGQRRGRGFRKVAYEVEEDEGREKKRRKKEERRKEKDEGVVHEREEVSDKKKKKKKDKDRQ